MLLCSRGLALAEVVPHAARFSGLQRAGFFAALQPPNANEKWAPNITQNNWPSTLCIYKASHSSRATSEATAAAATARAPLPNRPSTGAPPPSSPWVHGSLARAGKVRGQTPKVAKQDKKKKPRGRAHKRMQYNRRFVTAVVGFGKKRGPNSSEKNLISGLVNEPHFTSVSTAVIPAPASDGGPSICYKKKDGVPYE
ncbi:hypothetical protein EJB05_19343, partial [Eragrostis curvula]